MGLLFRRKKHINSYVKKNDSKKSASGGSKNRTQSEGAATTHGKIEWSRLRINLIFVGLAAVWLLIWGRAWQLQMIEGPRLADKAKKQHMASELVSGKRGLIYDRNGQILAKSVEVKSVYAHPSEVENVPETAKKLAEILNMPLAKVEGILRRDNKNFVWVSRKIDDNAATAIRKANLSGIGLSKEFERFYPFKHMAGQLLGFVGMDDKGLEGLERSLDSRLGVMPVRQIVQRDAMGRKFYLRDEGEPAGEDVHLTLDMGLQFIAEEVLAKVTKEFDARWSGALIVDLGSGDILSWAQYPFFNPNMYRGVSPSIYRNRIASDALEPGSTFKPLVMAAALQEKKVTPNTLINCEGGKWVSKKYTIRDTSNRDILPASKVMRYSSNIGMAKIGLDLGSVRFHKYLMELGFGSFVDLPLSTSKGILRKPRDWSEIDTMATAFGQSISVTILQMAQAYLTMLNHGVYKPLRLVMSDERAAEPERRIFSDKTVDAVMNMMRDVVEEPDGTGKRAKLTEMEMGGKTGTAQKADSGAKSYGEKRLASFVGFLPAKQPKYLILVFVDEPTRNQYGGIVAAPAFKEIAARVMTHTGILDESKIAEKKVPAVKHSRGLRLAGVLSQPWSETALAAVPKTQGQEMNNPGHLAKAASRVPDVMGKSVRNAVELFARAGIVPVLKGTGQRVIRQTPPPGSPWPKAEKDTNFILWLSER